MHFKTATISEKHGRDANQDFLAYHLSNGSGCWVLADGLGGHRGGEVASHLAVSRVIESFTVNPKVFPGSLKQHIDAAHQAINSRQREDFALASMRTTLVLLLVDRHGALWAHVGDSRLYHFRDRRLVFQTKDHSVPQSLVNAGEINSEDIRFHEDRNRLLRALGQEGELKPSIESRKQPIQPGDVFLLCTDGFWECVTETEMEVDLLKVATPQDWLKKMQARLLKFSLNLKASNRDNYSAIAVFIEK